ncbi:hypothetical protein SFUMM280S_05935 [Streptomyces fumanus]
MELGKSVSQPPVPKPTWPKISRCRKDVNASESHRKP